MKFEARIPEYDGEDEWHEITAYDAGEAAEKLTEEHDWNCAEGLTEGTDVQVKDGDEILHYRVHGYTTYVYSSTRIHPIDKEKK